MAFDLIIERFGKLVTLRRTTESIDEEGYSTKTYTDSSVTVVMDEISGLEVQWLGEGMAQAGDTRIFFDSNTEVDLEDLIIDENKQVWEILEKYVRTFGPATYTEVIARKK